MKEEKEKKDRTYHWQNERNSRATFYIERELYKEFKAQGCDADEICAMMEAALYIAVKKVNPEFIKSYDLAPKSKEALKKFK